MTLAERAKENTEMENPDSGLRDLGVLCGEFLDPQEGLTAEIAERAEKGNK